MWCVPGLQRVAGWLCDEHWMSDGALPSQAQVCKDVVQDLLLVGEVDHHVPVKLVLQGGAHSLDVCNVVANQNTVSLTLKIMA